jgi:hypothetical protein
MTAVSVKKRLAVLKSVLQHFMRYKETVNYSWFAMITHKMVYFVRDDMKVGVTVPETGLLPSEEIVVSFVHLNAALAVDSERLVIQKTSDPEKVMINDVPNAVYPADDTILRELAWFGKGAEYRLLLPLPSWDLISRLRLAEADRDFRYWLNGTHFDLASGTVVCSDDERMHVARSPVLPQFARERLNELCSERGFQESDERYEERLKRFTGITIQSRTMTLLETMCVDSLRVSRNKGLGVSVDERFFEGCSDFGYIASTTIQGDFPDHKGFCLTREQAQEWKTRVQATYDKQEIEKSPARLGPKTIKFAANTRQKLEAYSRALKSFKVKSRRVRLDFNMKAIGPCESTGYEWASIPLHAPFEMLDGEVPADFGLGVCLEIDHLIDALVAIPDGIVVVGTDESEFPGLSFFSADGSCDARVLACRS